MASATELVELQQTLYASKNPTRRSLHGIRREWIVAALRRYGGQHAGHALEVGPGSGVYLPILSEFFSQVTASDVEPAYLQHARTLQRKYGNLDLVVDDITASQLPGETFDLILCSEVVEHLKDSAQALGQMHNLLKPGGVLVLSTPQRWSLLEMTARIAFLPGVVEMVKLVYGEPVLEMGHINLMTRAKVKAQLRNAGFRIREEYVSGLYLPLVAEFLGSMGLRVERRLESKIRRGPLNRLLWTQYYVAEKSALWQ